MSNMETEVNSWELVPWGLIHENILHKTITELEFVEGELGDYLFIKLEAKACDVMTLMLKIDNSMRPAVRIHPPESPRVERMEGQTNVYDFLPQESPENVSMEAHPQDSPKDSAMSLPQGNPRNESMQTGGAMYVVEHEAGCEGNLVWHLGSGEVFGECPKCGRTTVDAHR